MVVVVDLMWMARETNPGWRCKVCIWMCGVWLWDASWGGLPGGSPATCSPETKCMVCIWCVCLSVIGGVCEGDGWLSLECKDINFFFVLSCLWYCFCDEEGQPSLESNEHLVCLGAVRSLK